MLGKVLEKLALPGAVNHWLSRKCEIDRLARQAAQDGFAQLLVIGAGFDTLSFRMAEEGLFTRVISADHPATLAALPPLSAGVEFFPLDLSSNDPVPEVSPLPTLIILEGLLMYLPETTVKRLLGNLSQLEVPCTRLVASWMLETPGRPAGFREQSWFISIWLRLRGEPMLWATTPVRLTDLLKSAGWSELRLIRFGLESEQLAVADAAIA
jgi:O-methyltransferase involved in polyketide biosynthesis